MAQIDSASKSSRLLASRRYTHNPPILGTAQEAFTNVLDLNASEIYTETNLVPTSSLPFSGSTQHLATTMSVLKYYYRQRLTPSNTNNEVWFFLNPVGSSDGIGAQLIDTNQQVNFISPKYSETSLANAHAEANPPGYGVRVFLSSSTGESPISINDFQFDYKTGVLQFLNSSVAPSNNEYVCMTAYQYIGKTLSDGLVSEGTISSSAQIIANLPTDTVSSSAQIVLDNVSEGSTNLFYTDTRVKTKLDAEGVFSGSDQVSLGSVNGNSDDVSEGSTNLYYTDARVKAKLDTEGVFSGSDQV